MVIGVSRGMYGNPFTASKRYRVEVANFDSGSWGFEPGRVESTHFFKTFDFFSRRHFSFRSPWQPFRKDSLNYFLLSFFRVWVEVTRVFTFQELLAAKCISEMLVSQNIGVGDFSDSFSSSEVVKMGVSPDDGMNILRLVSGDLKSCS